MKKYLVSLLILGLVLSLGGLGCRKKNTALTKIPGRAATVGDTDGTGGLASVTPVPGDMPSSSDIASSSIGMSGRGLLDDPNHREDREMFKGDTVYFDVDSAAIKKGEARKLDNVAAALKANASAEVLIEGYCDERGTEGYNLGLGEKRAQGLREFLVTLGLSPSRVHTISYGEAKPAVDGRDERAWAKNRRGEFVLLLPAQ